MEKKTSVKTSLPCIQNNIYLFRHTFTQCNNLTPTHLFLQNLVRLTNESILTFQKFFFSLDNKLTILFLTVSAQTYYPFNFIYALNLIRRRRKIHKKKLHLITSKSLTFVMSNEKIPLRYEQGLIQHITSQDPSCYICLHLQIIKSFFEENLISKYNRK